MLLDANSLDPRTASRRRVQQAIDLALLHRLGAALLPEREAKHADTIARDSRVYSTIRVDNETKFGTGYLHHVVRYDPVEKKIANLGVIAVKNPDFFDFKCPQAKNSDGSLRPRHGFHTLPDGTLTPLHVVMATIVAKDGTIYATTIYPFTLLRIPPMK